MTDRMKKKGYHLHIAIASLVVLVMIVIGADALYETGYNHGVADTDVPIITSCKAPVKYNKIEPERMPKVLNCPSTFTILAPPEKIKD